MATAKKTAAKKKAPKKTTLRGKALAVAIAKDVIARIDAKKLNVLWAGQHGKGADRLRAICENIIANGGRFVMPPVLKQVSRG